jgi:hypothetical protein
MTTLVMEASETPTTISSTIRGTNESYIEEQNCKVLTITFKLTHTDESMGNKHFGGCSVGFVALSFQQVTVG